MKIELDRTLFFFQLKALLTDRMSLWQLAVAHWLVSGLVFGKKGVAAAAAADASLWANYGLFVCSCLALMVGGVAVSFILVKPRTYGMVELLLASPLSPRKLASTSFAACFSYILVNMALHFVIVGARFGAAPYGAGFYSALAASLCFAGLVVFGTGILSLTRNDAEQLHVILFSTGLALFVSVVFTKLQLSIPVWLPPALAGTFLLCSFALWRNFHALVTREKAVLA